MTGAKFLLGVDPLTAAWPYQGKVSGNWWKFGFPVFYITALLQVAAAAVGLVYLLFQPGNPTSAKLPREVSVAQAAALRDEGAFIVDVREPSEWEQGHLEGATLISLGQLL